MEEYKFVIKGTENGATRTWKVVFNGISKQDAQQRAIATLQKAGVKVQSVTSM